MSVIWLLSAGMLAVALLAGRPSTWLTTATAGPANVRSMWHATTPVAAWCASVMATVGLAAYTAIIGNAAALGRDHLQALVLSPAAVVFVGAAALLGGVLGHNVWLVRPTSPGQLIGRLELTLAGSLLGLCVLGVAVTAAPLLGAMVGLLPTFG